jgi:hypothetical protein
MAAAFLSESPPRIAIMAAKTASASVEPLAAMMIYGEEQIGQADAQENPGSGDLPLLAEAG